MTKETIPGTRAVAQRLVNAEEHFLALVMESGFDRSEAEIIFATYLKHRCVKRQGVDSYVVKHGGFWDKAALCRALELGKTGKLA